jgi:hypothetical protein
MLYPNPYFFFRRVKERDWVYITRWMGGIRGLPDGRELMVLKQLKREHRDRERAGGARPRMAVVGGRPAFLLELTSEGEVYLTGMPVIHVSPWKALLAWGYSIPFLIAEEGLTEVRIPLPDVRVAEGRALRQLGCRREEKEWESGVAVWVWRYVGHLK